MLRKPNGDSYLTNAELTLIGDRLKDAHVVLSEYPYLDFCKGVKEGKYHLYGNNTMESHMTEYVLKEKSVGYVGVHFRNTVDPVLFIKPKELFPTNLYWEDNPGRQVWGTLGKIVVYKATHLASKGTRHEFMLEEYMGSRVRMYSEKEVDKPYEVYARIN